MARRGNPITHIVIFSLVILAFTFSCGPGPVLVQSKDIETALHHQEPSAPKNEQEEGSPLSNVQTAASVAQLARTIESLRRSSSDPADDAEIERLETAITSQLQTSSVVQTAGVTEDGRQLYTSSDIGRDAFVLSKISPELAEGQATGSHGGSRGETELLAHMSCDAEILDEQPTAWNSKRFILHSEVVPDTDQIVAVVVADSLSLLRSQYKAGTNLPWYNPPIAKLGLQVVRFSMIFGTVNWVSGTGDVGSGDGDADKSQFSADVDAIVMQPTCSMGLAAAGICPASTRPGFFSRTQWLQVADSGNCAVRQIDLESGRTTTRWGSGCLPAGSPGTAYVDSEIAAENVLGSNLGIAWVGWKFLLILDGDANRIRKYVESQHQGLSNLAGLASSSACFGPEINGDGNVATFCGATSGAVTSSLDFAVVSEPTVGRLRLLNFSYTYLPGGEVDDVTCIVTTLSAYTPGSHPFLFTDFGGLRFTPDDKYLVAGSATLDVLSYTYLPSPNVFEMVMVSMETKEVRGVVYTSSGLPVSSRTLVDIRFHPTNPGSMLLVMAEQSYVVFNEPNAAFIEFYLPISTLVTSSFDLITYDLSCAQIALLHDQKGGGSQVLRGDNMSGKHDERRKFVLPRHVGIADQEGAVRLVDLGGLLELRDVERNSPVA